MVSGPVSNSFTFKGYHFRRSAVHERQIQYLRIFTNEHNNDWDDWVNYYSFAYNTTPNLDHGYTPFELVFGRSEKIENSFYSNTINPIYNYEDYAKELQFRLHTAYIRTRQYIEDTKQRTIDNQKIVNPIKVNLGDKVAVINENRKKLEQVYNGPYTVIEISDPNIKISNNQGTHQTLHKNRLIKL